MSAGDSAVGAAARDIVTDFQHGSDRRHGDKIDLSAIDANVAQGGDQAFAFVSTPNVQANSITWYEDAQKHATIVQGDINGDRVADFQIELTGLKLGLAATDFLL